MAFAVLALVAFTGCAYLPATQGDLEAIAQAQEDALAGQQTAMEGVQEANLAKVVMGSVFSALSSLSAAIGLSRRRRQPQILADKMAKMRAAETPPEA